MNDKTNLEDLSKEELLKKLKEYEYKYVDKEVELEVLNENFKLGNVLLEGIVDNIPVALFVKDYSGKEGKFIVWNKEATQLWGLEKDQVLGRSDYDLFPKDQADFFQQKDRETLEENERIYIESEPVESPIFGNVQVHTWKIPINDQDGNRTILVGISQKIES